VPDFCALWRALNASAGDRWRRSSHCSAGTPDSPVNYSGADSRSWRVQSCSPLGHRTLSDGAPDSPVNYSGAPLKIPEGEELGVECPSAPDSPVRQTRAHFDILGPFVLNPYSLTCIGLL
jgi:hypothetical protein